jgi:hypothetical protein
MTSAIIDIDHLMVSVERAQDAGATMERLGFVATPRSAVVAMGLSNRLLCFPGTRKSGCNFIELMGIDDRAKLPPVMTTVLGSSEKPVSMVMVSDDARAAEADLRARGFDVGPAIHAKRDWVLPGGETITPEFVVCIPQPGRSPLYWNVCQYITPQHYKRAEFLGHKNGALGFVAVLAVAADPAAIGGHYADVWGASTRTTSYGAAVKPGDVELRLFTPTAAEAAFPGAAAMPATGAAYLGAVFAMRDLTAARGIAEKAGFAPISSASGYWIRPERTHGMLMAFERAA